MAPSSSVACRVGLAVAVAVLLLMTPWCAAQATPLQQVRQFVALHNKARAEVAQWVGHDVGIGPVSWNATVAAFAQSRAAQMQRDCQRVIDDSESNKGPREYGENLLFLFVGVQRSLFYQWSAYQVVGNWVLERKMYDHDGKKCIETDRSCKEYTQVIWRNSTSIGCASAVCDDDKGVFIFVCNYYPAGNIASEKPY